MLQPENDRAAVQVHPDRKMLREYQQDLGTEIGTAWAWGHA
jgi:hypothetical protein